MDFGTWLSQFKPADFSITVLVYMLVTFLAALTWFKLVPDYLNKERPFQRELKIKRLDAELEIKRAEVVEQAKMRQAMEQLSTVSARIALLVESHHAESIRDLANVQALVRIILEKQGVPTSEIAKYIGQQENEMATRLAAAAKLVLENQGGEARVN